MDATKRLRTIGAEVWHCFYSWPFWAAVLLTLLLCSATEIPQLNTSSLALICNVADLPFALNLGAGSLFLKLTGQTWFIVLLPVIAGLPFAYDFYMEWFGGSYYSVIHRQGRLGYTLAKAVSAAVSAGCAVFFGLLLYAMILFVRFGSSADLQVEQAMLEGSQGAVSPFLLQMAALTWNIVAVSMVIALFSLVLIVVLRQNFLALTIPMMIQYLSFRLTDFYTGLQLQQYAQDNDMDALYGRLAITYLLPSNQFSVHTIFHKYTGLPLPVYYLFLLATALLLIYLLHMLMERRVRNYA